MKKRIGLVGLGLMGSPMARNWLKKCFELHVLPHRRRESAEDLARAGAKIAGNLKEISNASDVIVLMVPTSREVEELSLGSPGLIHEVGPEKAVIDMSTSDPLSTKKIHEAFRAKGLRFFDAPVTGGVKGAENGTLTLFVGGPRAWFEETRDILEAVSRVQGHFGEAGNGHVAKLINNFLCIGNLAVFSEALPLAAKFGLDSRALFDILLSGMGSSDMLKFYGPQILQGDFEPRFKLAHAFKDLRLAENLARHASARLPVLEGMIEDFKGADAAQLGEKNLSAVILPLEEKLQAKFRN